MKDIYKVFESKLEGLKDAVFDSGDEKCAAHFTKILEDIVSYVQITYSSNVEWMIRDVEQPIFTNPT